MRSDKRKVTTAPLSFFSDCPFLFLRNTRREETRVSFYNHVNKVHLRLFCNLPSRSLFYDLRYKLLTFLSIHKQSHTKDKEKKL